MIKSKNRNGALTPLAKKKTISEEVAERIVLAIASGEQMPGDRLTEKGISDAMDISRVPVREALMQLEAVGVLVPTGGRGLQVGSFSKSKANELREIRLALEPIAFQCAIASVRSDPSKLEALDATLAELSTLAGTDDGIRVARCDIRFHREIIELSESELLLRTWSNLEPHMLIQMCNDWHYHDDRIGELQMHRELREFLVEGDIADIGSLLDMHIPKIVGIDS